MSILAACINVLFSVYKNLYSSIYSYAIKQEPFYKIEKIFKKKISCTKVKFFTAFHVVSRNTIVEHLFKRLRQSNLTVCPI